MVEIILGGLLFLLSSLLLISLWVDLITNYISDVKSKQRSIIRDYYNDIMRSFDVEKYNKVDVDKIVKKVTNNKYKSHFRLIYDEADIVYLNDKLYDVYTEVYNQLNIKEIRKKKLDKILNIIK